MKKVLILSVIFFVFSSSCTIDQDNTDVPSTLLDTWIRGSLNNYSTYESYHINSDSIVHRKILTNVTYSPHSKCPKCGNNQFELAALHLTNTKFSPWVIQCGNEKCGAVLGVVPREDLSYHAKHS
jgi:hypothetical protein